MSHEFQRSKTVSRTPFSLGPLAKLSAIVLLAAGSTGCQLNHAVTFQDAKYTTGAKQQTAAVVAVIDKSTLERKVTIKSWTTGIANNWEAQPGDMLKQVADIELPQMFSSYEFSTTDKAPPGSGPAIVLGLTVPNYTFANFHASVTVHAVSKTRSGKLLFEKDYSAEGPAQGGKMFIGGAFAMKSAIRSSSLNAYQQIFTQMRADLEKELANPQVAAK
jgi:hypothetical protein